MYSSEPSQIFDFEIRTFWSKDFVRSSDERKIIQTPFLSKWRRINVVSFLDIINQNISFHLLAVNQNIIVRYFPRHIRASDEFQSDRHKKTQSLQLCNSKEKPNLIEETCCDFFPISTWFTSEKKENSLFVNNCHHELAEVNFKAAFFRPSKKQIL